MKRMFPQLAAMIAAIVLMASCSKKDDNTNTNPGQPTIVGSWKVTGLVSNVPLTVGGQSTTEFFQFYPACAKDNMLVFKSDKSYEANEGATKCDPNDPQVTDTGNWTVDGTKLEIKSRTASSISATLVQLDNTTLKFSFDADFNGTPYVATYTYTRQ